ncbi:MAG: hypothetical protein UU88_C0002G0059 [Parcubacteria group bacterium GW2011_GWC1_42_11]|uniref:Uncharacterized protein n=1 Tax=Candidatus Nomurabacteria bacterium GW2011_GWC2_42_20 TaxID=1618756 RepID=A0A0G0ZGC4_9BACT|nr:MAG: hypothetical protein UU88_C0002G0059 [Parcubacteria group bacterium GW2011_GWC1_42_11]KKS47762.1 MAG: hypothetical protein UV12_C0005G0037 [Candidatus Nomurabacteria bacterium GW2011_GWC2_42_20]KKT09399.1 MAG: hypothetical protein UV86_C0008G0020 [Candidatus Nomurabacteria bacterium GW2011_GWB1_43_20]TAN36662.1 MAG: hypothetical protein EPN27_01445 [Patescibacteria group bacterium]HBH71656.1 hypothetical protein [Candidatus Yonathbacteria bacterium]
MENGPQIRTIGNASHEEKEKARQEFLQRLFSHFDSLNIEERNQLEEFEYPKTEKELACIDFANKETNELMKDAGIEPYDIPVENFHIIPSELYKKAYRGSGVAVATIRQQGILFNGDVFRDNPAHFGVVALHETLHLKSHLSLEVKERGEKIKTTPYRHGVSVLSLQEYDKRQEFHEHFRGLHEAIVSVQEKKSFTKFLESPWMSEERKWLLSDEAQSLKKDVSQKKGIPEDDIIWVGKKDKEDWETVSYPKQRMVLDLVCKEIQEQFPEQYQNSDEVFKEFLKSHFTGQLLHIARLVEKTFGEGSFRVLGNMGTDKSSGVLHLETLKKARMRQMRSQ